MALRIPDSDKPKLAKLLALTADEHKELYRALATVKPSLKWEDFSQAVAASAKIGPEIVADSLRILLNLSWVAADQKITPDDVLDEIGVARVEAALPEPVIGWTDFKASIVAILSLDKTLGVTSKALFIATQFPCHFHGGRVLTDARPVFGGDPSSEPVAFVLAHTLQLEVHQDEGRKEWFVSLDTEDLEALRATIDRALAKEKSLRDVLSRTGVQILEAGN